MNYTVSKKLNPIIIIIYIIIIIKYRIIILKFELYIINVARSLIVY